MNSEDLAHTVAQMKKLGILHLKTPEVEILLGAGHLPPPTVSAWDTRNSSRKPLTDEELLFAATEGFPDEKDKNV